MKEDQNVEIELPQGTELTNIAGVDMPSGDIGHALQLVEFCETFGEVEFDKSVTFSEAII